jgi:hypothetical protein
VAVVGALGEDALGEDALGEDALGLAAGDEDDDGTGDPPPKQPERMSAKARPIEAGRYRCDAEKYRTNRAFMGKV